MFFFCVCALVSCIVQLNDAYGFLENRKLVHKLFAQLLMYAIELNIP